MSTFYFPSRCKFRLLHEWRNPVKENKIEEFMCFKSQELTLNKLLGVIFTDVELK